MSLLYPGRIEKLEIGVTNVNNVDIENVVLMNWERNHDVRPRLYANRKYPTTYQQPHSWILGSFSVLSDHHEAVYETDVDGSQAGDQPAMVPYDDSNVIDYFKVTYEDEDGENRITRFYHALIYRFNKELLNYDDSVWVYHFMAGYAVDSEELYDLITSSDAGPTTIAVHEGISCGVNTTCEIAVGAKRGLTIDPDGNLVTVDETTNSLYIMDGISCTVNTSCSLPGSFPTGVTIDGDGNLIVADRGTESLYFLDGVTCSVNTSCTTPSSYPMGLTVDGDDNLISTDMDSESIYFHSGLTCAVDTSCSTPGSSPSGLTMDGDGNIVSADLGTDSIYIHDGLTCDVSTSCSTSIANPWGLTAVPR